MAGGEFEFSNEIKCEEEDEAALEGMRSVVQEFQLRVLSCFVGLPKPVWGFSMTEALKFCVLLGLRSGYDG